MKTRSTIAFSVGCLVMLGIPAMIQLPAYAQIHFGVNSISGTDSSVAAGTGNAITNDYSLIGSGDGNTINNVGYANVITGGEGNTISDVNGYSVISGGDGNVVSGDVSGIMAGDACNIQGSYCFIGSGSLNGISGTMTGFSAIVSGTDNSINTNNCFIGAGGENTITGYYSVIAGGYFNTNSGEISATGGGEYNLVSGDDAFVAGGFGAAARLYGQSAHASGTYSFPIIPGEAQASEYVLRNVSSNTSSTELFLDGSSQRMVLPTNGTWSFDILVTVRGTNGQSGGFRTNGVIKVYNGTTTMVGGVNPITVPVIATDVGAWNVAVSADNTHGALAVKVNGDSNTNRWVATVHTTEVKF